MLGPVRPDGGCVHNPLGAACLDCVSEWQRLRRLAIAAEAKQEAEELEKLQVEYRKRVARGEIASARGMDRGYRALDKGHHLPSTDIAREIRFDLPLMPWREDDGAPRRAPYKMPIKRGKP